METSDRPLPPPLEARAPDCSICGRETHYEDGWNCENCGCWWDPSGYKAFEEPGTWNDEDLPRCASIYRPYEVANRFLHEKGDPDVQYQCILSAEHDPDGKAHHEHPDYILGWTGTMEPRPTARNGATKEYFPEQSKTSGLVPSFVPSTKTVVDVHLPE